MAQHRPGGPMRHVKPAKYMEDKAAGLVEIVMDANDKPVVKKKVFNRHTGEEMDPEITEVTKEQLEQRKESLLVQVENIDEMIKDIDALD